jgi:hypothetical protein
MSPEEALKEVVPTVAISDQRSLNQLGMQLQVGYTPGATPTLNDVKSAPTNLTSPSALTNGALTNGASPVQANSLQVDALTQYIAATALFQEVQLMNMYVKDAAVDPERSAYLVRLQVSLMPSMRNAPYDAYSLVSFFAGPFEIPDICGVSNDPMKVSSSSVSKGIKVIPLLVTDDIEGIIASRSSDRVRQYGLALGGTAQGIGGSANVQGGTQNSSALLGRELNSTFTVARVCENTIQCRFGASQNGNNEPVMIPQTHNVTVLLLVPRDLAENEKPQARTVRLAACNWSVDKKGNPCPGRTYIQDSNAVWQVLSGYGFKKGLDDFTRGLMIHAARTNNFPDFERLVLNYELQNRDLRPLTVEMLWADFVRVRNASQYASAFFVVPMRRAANLSKEFAPLVFDDEKVARVTLRGGVALDEFQLQAMLVVNQKALPADRIQVLDRGTKLVIEFPSLVACSLVAGNNGPAVKPQLKIFAPESGCGTAFFDSECEYLRVSKGANEPANAAAVVAGSVAN